MTALRADSGGAGLLLPMAALVAGGVCLGVAPVAVKALDLAPEVSAFYRVLLAAPVFALSAMLLPRPSPTNGGKGASVGLYALAAFVFAADLVVMHLAIRMADVAVATLLTNCAPFFVGLMGLVGLADKPRRSFWLALPVALFGAALLIGANVSGGGSALGDALALYAGYLVCVRALRERGASTVAIMASVTGASALLLVPLFLAAGAPVPTDAETWALLAALVIVGQLAGQGLVVTALKDLPVSLGSLVLLLQPVSAAALSWAWLGEVLAPVQVVGIAVVLLAIAGASLGSGS